MTNAGVGAGQDAGRGGWGLRPDVTLRPDVWALGLSIGKRDEACMWIHTFGVNTLCMWINSSFGDMNLTQHDYNLY